MPSSYGDVRTWQAKPLGAAGDGIRKDLKVLEECGETLETKAIPSSWSGSARVVAQLGRRALLVRLSRHVAGKRRVQRALYDAERQVTGIERLVADVEGEAKAKEFAIADDGRVTDTSTPPTFKSRFDAEEWRRIRTNQAQAIADDVGIILSRAAAVDATLTDSIPAGHVTDVDEYGTASPEVAERWAELSDRERRAIIEEMVVELADENGVQDPTIEWMDEAWDANGQWSDGQPGTVRFNEGMLDDPRILHTVAHEMRHGRQFEAMRDKDDWHWPWQDDPLDEHTADGITEEQVEQWQRNFDDYQSTSNGDSYEDYFTQPVEEDARDSGREYLDGLSDDELDRLLQESR